MRQKAIIIVLLMAVAVSARAESGYSPPGKTDKCPVCGMFVYKYPDWAAAARLSDGRLLYFDGAKDLFKYVLNTGGDRTEALTGKEALFVTEYYALEVIDAREAFYVTGSDVMGPMGRELVPFRTRKEAMGFMDDHGGTRLLVFGDVTPDVLMYLDTGRPAR